MTRGEGTGHWGSGVLIGLINPVSGFLTLCPKRCMKYKLIFIIILLLASVLRLIALNEFPAGLNADEAAIGYNAYSLIQTGKDEFGHSWPINFQSFNDFKPGLYFYLVLPFVKVLGLNEWAVRLPSAILGIFTVGLIYLFANQIFKNRTIALISALILAINPWYLHFSRGGWESNTSVFFILSGVYFFIKFTNLPSRGSHQSLSSHFPVSPACNALPRMTGRFSLTPLLFHSPFSLILSSVSFILSMYTYHSARLISPLLVLGLVIIFWRNIFSKEKVKQTISAGVIGFIILLPFLLTFKGEAGVSRFSGVGLFADTGPFWRANELRTQHSDYLGILPVALHNKYLEYSIRFADNYLRHFSGSYLFISGDEIQRNRVPETGQFLLIEVPFLILGLYFLIKNKPDGWRFIFWWLLIAPLASSLTFQSPHAIRSLNMVIPLVIIISYGLYQTVLLVKGTGIKYLIQDTIYVILALAYLCSFSSYLHQYYIHYPKTYPAAWEYGFKDLAGYLKMVESNYERVYITDKYDQPYILTAFYLKYPPEKMQVEAKLTPKDQFGFSTVSNLGKYHFGSIKWQEDYPSQSLIVGSPSEIPDDATILKRIYYTDGVTEAFRIIER